MSALSVSASCPFCSRKVVRASSDGLSFSAEVDVSLAAGDIVIGAFSLVHWLSKSSAFFCNARFGLAFKT